MNYNHHFHAGNFADVIKHLLLIYLIEYNKLKKKPIVFFDSHAGSGLYDLTAHQALRSGEYLNGIGQVIKQINNISITYNNIIANCNHYSNTLSFYPGSPYILANLMGKEDRLILIEKKAEFKEELQRSLKAFKTFNIQYHLRDGFEALNALLPSKEKRAIILIDPAFEKNTDWNESYEAIRKLLAKFRNAQIILWYPIKNKDLVEKFYQQINTIQLEKIILEVTNSQIDESKMNQCGYIIFNPCFGLGEFVAKIANEFKQWDFKYSL